MKFLLTFYIFLCFHLFGGQGSVHASSHAFNAFHSPDLQIEKIKAVERTGEVKHSLLTNHPEIPGENELPLFIEDGDDEIYTRKCKLPVESFSICYYAFVTSYPCRDLTKRFSVRSHPFYIRSSKYIAQRVLRI